MGPYQGKRNFLSSFCEPADANDKINSKGPSTETRNLAEQFAETSTSEIGKKYQPSLRLPSMALRLGLRQRVGFLFYRYTYHLGLCRENKSVSQGTNLHSPTRVLDNDHHLALLPLASPMPWQTLGTKTFFIVLKALPRGITKALPAKSTAELSDSPIRPGTVLFPQLAFLEHNKLLWVTNCVPFYSAHL